MKLGFVQRYPSENRPRYLCPDFTEGASVTYVYLLAPALLMSFCGKVAEDQSFGTQPRISVVSEIFAALW